MMLPKDILGIIFKYARSPKFALVCKEWYRICPYNRSRARFATSGVLALVPIVGYNVLLYGRDIWTFDFKSIMKNGVPVSSEYTGIKKVNVYKNIWISNGFHKAFAIDEIEYGTERITVLVPLKIVHSVIEAYGFIGDFNCLRKEDFLFMQVRRKHSLNTQASPEIIEKSVREIPREERYLSLPAGDIYLDDKGSEIFTKYGSYTYTSFVTYDLHTRKRLAGHPEVLPEEDDFFEILRIESTLIIIKKASVEFRNDDKRKYVDIGYVDPGYINHRGFIIKVAKNKIVFINRRGAVSKWWAGVSEPEGLTSIFLSSSEISDFSEDKKTTNVVFCISSFSDNLLALIDGRVYIVKLNHL